jgi:hypothetical protein
MTPLATLAHAPATTEPTYAVPERVLTVFTANIVETRGMLARIAVQLNPYDVRELTLCLETCTLRVVVEGNGFDAGRVAARLDKVIGVLEVSYS